MVYSSFRHKHRPAFDIFFNGKFKRNSYWTSSSGFVATVCHDSKNRRSCRRSNGLSKACFHCNLLCWHLPSSFWTAQVIFIFIYLYVFSLCNLTLSVLNCKLLEIYRLGFLVDFLSHAAIVGFMGGAAIVIGLQQLKGLFGINHFTTDTDVISVLNSVFSSFHHQVSFARKIYEYFNFSFSIDEMILPQGRYPYSCAFVVVGYVFSFFFTYNFVTTFLVV